MSFRRDVCLLMLLLVCRAGWADEVAWIALFLDKRPERALEDARVAGGVRNGEFLHTQAAVEADAGLLEDAIGSLHRSIALQSSQQVQAHHWFVIGWIAEHCGLTEAAESAYRKVAPSDKPLSTHKLAQRRLLALQAAKSKE